MEDVLDTHIFSEEKSSVKSSLHIIELDEIICNSRDGVTLEDLKSRMNCLLEPCSFVGIIKKFKIVQQLDDDDYGSFTLVFLTLL